MPCESGRYGAAEALASKDECTLCPPGSSCTTGATQPKGCNPGSTANTSGLGSCVSCRPGEYQNEPNATSCKPCSVASYCAGEGSSAPTPCPGGTWSGATGLMAEVQCIKVVKGQWAPTGSAAPEPCPVSGFYCPGYDAVAAHLAQNITPPGSKPILIDSGAARETRHVTVVTFGLTLEGDITAYNEVATKTALSALHGVPVHAISLEVVPASVQLRVTIRPADQSSTEMSRLTGSIEATTSTQLIQAFGSGATLTAVTVEEEEEEYEATCPAGSWCSAGVTIECPKDTYNDETDKSDQGACTACPDNAISPAGSASIEGCVCQAGFFAEAVGTANLTCVVCPVGAMCNASGVTLDTLPLEEGYWRIARNSTDVRRCPGNFAGSGCHGCFGDACVEGGSAIWASNHSLCKAEPYRLTGPYCTLCDTTDARIAGQTTYYDAELRECRICETNVALTAGVTIGAVVLLGCVGVAVAALLKRSADSDAKRNREPSRVSRMVRKEHFWWKKHAKSIKDRAKTKVKILWTFYQIATRVADTYVVTFPRSVERSINTFSFVSLELEGLGLPLACMSLGSFYNRLLFMMVAPIVLVVCVNLVGWVRRDRSHERTLREQHRRERENNSAASNASSNGESSAASNASSFNRAAAQFPPRGRKRRSIIAVLGSDRAIKSRRQSLDVLGVAFKQSTFKALPMALRVTFLAFPTVSSLAFGAMPFKCDDLDASDGVGIGEGLAVLSADYAVVCWGADGVYTDEYRRILWLAGVAFLAYPIAVPASYVFLLYKVRHAVWNDDKDNKLSQSVSFLTEEYDSTFFFWELVEAIKKLLLVGVMSVVMPGKINQLVVAFIIVLCFLVALMVARPFRRVEDDVMALATGFGLVMFFFFSLILKYQTLTEAVSDSLSGRLAETFKFEPSTNAALLISSTLGALVLACCMITVELSATAVTEAKREREMQALEEENKRLREREAATETEAAAMRAVLAEEKLPDVARRVLIDTSQLVVHPKDRLGQGAFGEVFKGEYNGTPVAVKKLHRSKLDEAGLRAFRAEFELQLSLRHPNLVQIIGGAWNLEDVNVCIVFELCERGTLEDLLVDPTTSPTLSWGRHKLPMATGIARALAHLHGQTPPIVHRDLKPENILVDAFFNAKIADLGASREVDLTRTMETAGTPLYSAPEVLRKEPYNEKVDVWSFACVLECMHTHANVFESVEIDTSTQRCTTVVDDLLRRIGDGQVRPTVPTGSCVLEVVVACSHVDAAERCTAKDALELLSAPELLGEATRLPAGPAVMDGTGKRNSLPLRADLPAAVGAAAGAATGGNMPPRKTLPQPAAAQRNISLAEAAPLAEVSTVFEEQRREAMEHAKSAGKKSAPGRKTERKSPAARPASIDEGELTA